MTPDTLRRASEGFRGAAGVLTTASERHGGVRDGVGQVVGSLEGTWVSPASRRYQRDAQRFLDQIRPIPQALVESANGLRSLASTADSLANELLVAQRQLTDASHQLMSIHHALQATDPQDVPRIRMLEQRRRDTLALQQRSERNIDDIQQRWSSACRRAEPVLRQATGVLRSVAMSGFGETLRGAARQAGRLGWGLAVAPLWPFERSLSRNARLQRLSSLATATAKEVASHIQGSAMRYVPGRWDRPTHYNRRGHWRRTPSGGRTWVRPHEVRNPHAQWIAGRHVPDTARRTTAGRIGTFAQRGGNVLTFGFATYNQYRDDSLDTSMATSERVGRAATAGAVVGGASVAGGMAGAKMGLAIGATVGSVIPVVGTAAGAVVGGVVGAVIGSNIGGKAASALGGGIIDGGGRAASAVTSAVGSAGNKIKGWFGR